MGDEFFTLMPQSGSGLKCLIGLEPYEHAHILYTEERLICNAMMMSCPKHPLWKEVLQLSYQRWYEKNATLATWNTKGVDDGEFGHSVLAITGPIVLNNAVDIFLKKQQQSHFPGGDVDGLISTASTNLLQLAEPHVFYPEVDFSNAELRHNCQFVGIQCTKGLTPEQCTRRLTTCNKTVQNDFKNVPPGKQSFAVHHWKHTWIGGQPAQPECSKVDVDNVPLGKWPEQIKSCETSTEPATNVTFDWFK